jgi:site-specific recombinase XerD
MTLVETLDTGLALAKVDAVEPPWPATTWPREFIAEQARKLPVGSQVTDKRSQRASSVDRLLSWLETFAGQTWQQRWDACGTEQTLAVWGEVPTRFICKTSERPVSAFVGHRAAVIGLNALLCLGVVRPSYRFMFASRLKDTYDHIRQLTDPQFFAEAFELCRRAGQRERHQLDAMHHLSRIVMRTGRGPRELTQDDLLSYYSAVTEIRQANSMALTWDIMRDTGVFPADTPTLRAVRKRGPRTVSELVDSHDVRCQPVRDLLIRYLSERAPSLDYSSLIGLVGNLVGGFWKDLEEHHPGIDSLHLAPEVARGWLERAKVRRGGYRKGSARTDPYGVLFVVRAFYQDLAQWALEEPYWVAWAAPCPVRDQHVRGSMKHKRVRRARMHQRTRTLVPMLPQLVNSVEARLRYVEGLHAAAVEVPIGGTFAVNGEVFERIQMKHDTGAGGQAGARRLRALRIADGQRLNLSQEEDEAFWTWAVVDTLRHTGVRIEELLELTHLALVTYRLADTGEIVPLLQIVPSKQDAERVLLVSPELAHVLARIIQRIRVGHEQVPLVARYDQHERITGTPLPHLFQRWQATERRVMSTAAVKRLLGLALERLALRGPDGKVLHYTPHDFRRIFATEAVAGGLPIHIAAKLLGHQDLNTTQTYAAVYQDDVLRHHAGFIARRRAERPGEEYREPTPTEWSEFERHFTRRKVELGSCARPYGTPCRHEHACLRCPMLRPDPAQAMRLAEIITNLHERVREATERGWLGEVEGLQVSLTGARQKLQQMRKIRTQATVISLGPTRR